MAPQNVNRSDSDPVATQTQHSHPPARELAAKKQQKKTRFAANPTRTSNLPTFHQNSTHIAHFGIKLLHIQLPTGSGTTNRSYSLLWWPKTKLTNQTPFNLSISTFTKPNLHLSNNNQLIYKNKPNASWMTRRDSVLTDIFKNPSTCTHSHPLLHPKRSQFSQTSAHSLLWGNPHPGGNPSWGPKHPKTPPNTHPTPNTLLSSNFFLHTIKLNIKTIFSPKAEHLKVHTDKVALWPE